MKVTCTANSSLVRLELKHLKNKMNLRIPPYRPRPTDRPSVQDLKQAFHPTHYQSDFQNDHQQQQMQQIIHNQQQHQMQQQQLQQQQMQHNYIFPQTKGCLMNLALRDFHLVKTIGTGTFGRVYLTQHGNAFHAIKVLKKVDVVRLKQVEHINSEVSQNNITLTTSAQF